MRDARTGRVLPVGTDNVRSASPLNIFRKAPVKAELAVEVLMPTEGRKMQAFYGRDAAGDWRGEVKDIGHVFEGNSPYTFIRVLDDEQVGLSDVQEMVEEMAEDYDAAIDRDHQEFETDDYYPQLKAYAELMRERAEELRRDFDAGMKAFFGPNWRAVAAQLFPQGVPRI